MPALYEKIRNQLVAHGKSLKKAKSEAAAVYNTIRHLHKNMPKLSNKPEGAKVTVKKIKKKMKKK